MFRYYLQLATYSFKRSRTITALMILAIGLGIGASMTMITVLHVMSGDPLPGRSAQLYVPVIDPYPVSNGERDKTTMPQGDMTWVDAMQLLHDARAEKQVAMSAGAVPIHPPQAASPPFFASGRYVTADFFAMFGTPFSAGGGWSAADDASHARVVVLNAELNARLFGDSASIGKTVRLKTLLFA